METISPKKINKEIARLGAMLRMHGIDEVRVGVELEFSPAINKKTSTARLDIKKQCLDELDHAIAAADDDQKQSLIIKKAAVSSLDIREILMYDLIERDERTRPLLEYLFGAGRGPQSYYDAEGVFELKIAHCLAEESVANMILIETVLKEKCRALGMSLHTPPAPHISFSFWSKGGNVLDPGHPEFESKGKKIAEGMTRAAFDIFPLFVGDFLLMTMKQPMALMPDRDNRLRSAFNRIEARILMDKSTRDLALFVPLMMAGGLAGLTQEEIPSVAFNKASIATTGIFECDDGFKITTHALNSAIVNADGRLSVSQGYIDKVSGQLGRELGKVDNGFLEGHWFEKEGITPGLIEFFNSIRLVQDRDGQSRIEWPETGAGKYKITIPECNMRRVPPQRREQIQNGASYTKEEMIEYASISETFPYPALEYMIDTSKLADAIKIIKTDRKIIVSPGYSMDIDGQSEPIATRLQRMMDSALYHHTLSDGFMSELRKTISARMPALSKPEIY